MKILVLALCIVLFVLGWYSANVYSALPLEDVEIPYQVSGSERASPSDWISEEQISVYKDRIVIRVENASWARYADSNSMDPVLDKGANGLEIVPRSEDDLKVGDIVAYECDWVDGVVVHRIIELGQDNQGWYAITKGDNNHSKDPSRVRFSDIKYVLVGLIY